MFLSAHEHICAWAAEVPTDFLTSEKVSDIPQGASCENKVVVSAQWMKTWGQLVKIERRVVWEETLG